LTGAAASDDAVRPRRRPPFGATDCHIHILDPDRFPYRVPGDHPPPASTVDEYLRVRSRLGLTRAVVVTPSNYGTDNRSTLDALGRLGRQARGVAVIDESFADTDLREMHVMGVRGIRFNLTRPGGAGAELIAPLAARIAPLGWHVQIHMTPGGILADLDRLRDLPADLVIDHAGRIRSTADPAFTEVLRLIDAGRTWVKLSGVYLESTDGPPAYADRAAVARAFLRAAPERMVWGTDWPHTTALRGEVLVPDDTAMLDMLHRWTGNDRTWERVLVLNPARLYQWDVKAPVG
jgi:D-galactarolactone isomerase